MKKTKAILISILSCLVFTMYTGNVFATEDRDNAQEVSASPSDADEALIGDGAVDEEPEPYEFDSYHLVDMRSLYLAKELSAEGYMMDSEFDTDTEGQLKVTEDMASYNSGQLKITKAFDFDAGPVGRFVLDGYSEKGVEAYVDVYIDDETDPICTIKLPEEKDDDESGNGETKYFPTADIYSRKLTGVHTVSFSFNLSGKAPAAYAYLILKSVEFAKTTIPVVYFDIDESQGTIDDMNESPDHSARCYGSVDIQVPDGYVSEYTGQVETDYTNMALEYIRGRGNSTWNTDKKPYKFKLDKGVDLFGMGKNKHWVLVANRFDNSNMRNRMTYWLGAKIGLEFTPQCIPVEVVMNDRYYGTYLLAEQVRIGTGRVEIDELDDIDYDAPAITGGYLVSMQPYPKEADENKFNTKRGVEFLSVFPDFS